MELKARHHFVRQIMLVSADVYRLKLFFDELFDEAGNYKSEVLRRMQERNERIREIYYYLNLDLDILDDVNNPKEDPGGIFVVTKDEVTIGVSQSPFNFTSYLLPILHLYIIDPR